jgi:isopentenyl-diphosphate delta-isomerase
VISNYTGGLPVEQIVIVDEDDNIIGEAEKEKCHDGDGILHRAILAMVFTPSGELLLTRRSEGKRLWPGYWDGTVASHPVSGEDYEQASKRRLRQEIGLVAEDVRYLFKFRYNARYENFGSENEMCAVTVVRDVDERRIIPDRKEISDVRTVAVKDLLDEVRDGAEAYTPWLKLALEHDKVRQSLLVSRCKKRAV